MHKTYSTLEAYDFCKDYVTTSHMMKWQVAISLNFVPSALLKYVYTLWAWSLMQDAVTDDATHSIQERLKKLEELDASITTCFHGVPQDPIFIALQDTVRMYSIPEELFHDINEISRQDLTVYRYQTLEDLFKYCKKSNVALGRMGLILYHYTDPQFLKYMDIVFSSLQLLDFIIDVAEDAQTNHIYLPIDHLKKFNCTEEMILSNQYTKEFRDVIAYEIGLIEEAFFSSLPAYHYVRPGDRFYLKIVFFMFAKLIEKIKQLDYNVYKLKTKLSLRDKIEVFTKAMLASNDISQYKKDSFMK